MATDKEQEKRELHHHKLRFMERLREHDPVRAYLYCDHGNYIGFGALFRNKCDYCMEGL